MFSSIFTEKGNNFFDFLLASLFKEAPQKVVSFSKGKVTNAFLLEFIIIEKECKTNTVDSRYLDFGYLE